MQSFHDHGILLNEECDKDFHMLWQEIFAIFSNEVRVDLMQVFNCWRVWEESLRYEADLARFSSSRSWCWGG